MGEVCFGNALCFARTTDSSATRGVRRAIRTVGYALALLAVCHIPARSQTSGRFQTSSFSPFVEHYTATDYESNPQNWSITQDFLGRVYIGNTDGLLSFDGQHWQTISSPGDQVVRSVAALPNGIIAVGLESFFGYVDTRAGAGARLVPASWSDSLISSDVWNILASSSAIFVHSHQAVLRVGNNRKDVWTSENRFHTTFLVNDRFFVRESNRGLLELVDGELQLIPNGEYFADKRVYAMASRGNGFLVGTAEEGLIAVDENSYPRPFDSPLQQFFAEHPIYHGRTLRDGTIGLATMGGGVIIVDKDANEVGRIDRETGLTDLFVRYIFEDAEGALWLALDNDGIARVDVTTPLDQLQFGASNSLGLITDLSATAERRLIATSNGLYELDPGAKPWLMKQLLPGVVRTVVVDGNTAFAGSDAGIFEVGKQQIFDESVNDFVRRDSGIVAVTNTGIAILDDNGSVETKISPADIDPLNIGSIHLDARGLWMTLPLESGIAVLPSPIEANRQPIMINEGLPESPVVPTSIAGETVFASVDGIYRVDWSSGSPVISRDSTLANRAFNEGQDLLAFYYEESRRRVWLAYKDRVDILTGSFDEGWTTKTPDVLRFAKESVTRLLVDDEGIAWISSGDDLYRYNEQRDRSYRFQFAPYIKRVTSRVDRSLIYGVGGPALSEALPYHHNDLEFEFVAPTFVRPAETKYQYRLDGKDQDWSTWSTDNAALYNNLREGDYTFRFRGRNYFGFVSEEGSYSFVVRPPWFRTNWAYAFYIFGFVIVGLLTYRYHRLSVISRRAKEQKKELDAERLANDRLTTANEKLRQANRLRDEFLATTSHELRTPLTAILGYAAVLKEEIPKQHHDFVDIIDESGNRLMRTLTSLLDLAKLRAQTMEVQSTPIEIVSIVESITRSRSNEADKKGLDMHLVLPRESVYVLGDTYCIEQIVTQLIDNSIKFTHSGSVTIGIYDEGAFVAIEVSDDGIGIDEEFLPHLFDEFKQESDGPARSHSGTGLGLAIVSGMVDLIQGAIDVRSQKTGGSTFSVYLRKSVHAGSIAYMEHPNDSPQPRYNEDHEPARQVRGSRSPLKPHSQASPGGISGA